MFIKIDEHAKEYYFFNRLESGNGNITLFMYVFLVILAKLNISMINLFGKRYSTVTCFAVFGFLF